MAVLPEWVQVLQAVTVVLIGVAASTIAFLQWWTARQKLVLDLFEKRFQCFIDVRSIASECFQLGKVTKPGGMNEVIARARFLFDSDIYERLIEMHSLVGQLEVGNETAANRIMDQFEKMLPVFNRYLRMTQRLPSLPWERKN